MPILNPLVYVKLICHQCGQKYAFDVLPVDNRMPTTVKCPVCRADGTPAANVFLAQKMIESTPPPKVVDNPPQLKVVDNPAQLKVVENKPQLKVVVDVPPTKVAGNAPQPPAPTVPGIQVVPSPINVPSVRMFPGASVFRAPGGEGANPGSDEEWRQRALEAEARAEKVQAALKASLTPQLAEFLKDAVVQGLATQRSELLKAMQNGALEISELVRRLDELKAPMQERQQAYEARIKELERELAERNEENRELLKLEIEMTRRQLETERTRSRLDFN